MDHITGKMMVNTPIIRMGANTNELLQLPIKGGEKIGPCMLLSTMIQ